MWGLESQRTIVRERMKLLLAAHNSEITPQPFTAEPGDLLLQQGASAERLLLLTEGSVAIQVRQGDGPAHTLAIVEAEELLGEMGLFGNGVHSADVVVVGGPAQLLAVDGDQLLQSMLFDADLSFEMLRLISQRCLQSNELVGQLLDGIKAAHAGDSLSLKPICMALDGCRYSMAEASDRLMQLARLREGATPLKQAQHDSLTREK